GQRRHGEGQGHVWCSDRPRTPPSRPRRSARHPHQGAAGPRVHPPGRQSLGRTHVWVGWDGEIRGEVVVADTVKATSAEAIVEFRRLGLRPILLTGDDHRSAVAVAAQVGIDPDDVVAQVRPAEKVDVVRLPRRTLGTIKGNLFWAFAYNLAALPLAAAGLLNPMIAGGAMAFSSVFVVTNILRLRRFER
ncbi:MAG: HAD family hydrolase, partial [Cellulomonas sp.]|nr:HAD family hydrolase [Cellulomonas sp.]